MLGWIKDKITGVVSDTEAANELREHLAPLEKVQGAQPKLVDRLTHFVLSGDGEGVVAELAAMQNTNHIFLVYVNYYNTASQAKNQKLRRLLAALPEDPELY